MDQLTTEEAAARLGMSLRRVQQLIRAGTLVPVRRIGQTQMLHTEDVERLAKEPESPKGWPRGRPRRAPAASPEGDA